MTEQSATIPRYFCDRLKCSTSSTSPKRAVPSSDLSARSSREHVHPARLRGMFQLRRSQDPPPWPCMRMTACLPVLRHAKRCLQRTQPRCYRILEHARLSSAKTTNAAIAHDRCQGPPGRPMAMPHLAVIMRMYCEAFVAPAWRAVKRKTGSRGSTPCTLGSPAAVSSVSVRARHSFTRSMCTYISE